MTRLKRAARIATAALFVSAVGACSSTGGLGGVLGSVLGGGSNQQLSGTVQGVDTRSQQVFLQQSNGQTIGVGYDSRTQVVFQNQSYSVNSLERGDQVTARLTNTNGGNNSNYYTDYIQVDQSVSSNGGNTSGNAQSIQGNVRQVDITNGWFTVNAGNNGVVTVTMPYNPSRNDRNRFQSLRSGDYVRFYATYVSNSRVELRQFY